MWAVNSFLLVLFVSRTTDVSTVGQFSIALTTAQLLYILGVFGTNSFQMTDFSFQFRFADYFWLKLVTCFAMLVLCVPILLLTEDRQQQSFVLLLTIFMAINAYAGIIQSMLFRHNRLDLSGQFLFYRHFLSLGAFILIQLLTRNVVLALLVLNVVDVVATWIWGRHYVVCYAEPDRSFDRERLKALFLECLPLFVSVFLMTYLLSVSKYAIQALLDSTAQGYFGILFTPVLIVNLCSQFVFRPALSRYAEELQKPEKSYLGRTLLRHGLLIVLFTLFCCAVLYFFGVPVIHLLYKVDVSAYRWDLVIILLGGGVFALCQLFYFILLLQRRQMQILLTYVLVAGVATGLSWAFVHLWSIRGASVAFLMCHVLLLACYLFFALRNVRNKTATEATNESASAS